MMLTDFDIICKKCLQNHRFITSVECYLLMALGFTVDTAFPQTHESLKTMIETEICPECQLK